VPKTHHFEMSIEEQAASLLADGLAFSSREPQINVFATFAAFFEGIAREGFEMWRYQRNLTGYNEGLNVIMHLSHVGRLHRPRSLLGLEPGLDQPRARLPAVPAPLLCAGRRARRFVAVRDAAAGYGGHIVAIPRDNLPVLTQADGRRRCGTRRRLVAGHALPRAAGRARAILASARRASSPARRAIAGRAGHAGGRLRDQRLPVDERSSTACRQVRADLTIEDG
jgi:hypothetical protein